MPVPPATVAQEARKGLRLRRRLGIGGTAVGVARARDLSNRRNISDNTLRRMRSYFARHEIDKKASGFKDRSSAGYVAWKMWGGDAGRRWAKMTQNPRARAYNWKVRKNPLPLVPLAIGLGTGAAATVGAYLAQSVLPHPQDAAQDVLSNPSVAGHKKELLRLRRRAELARTYYANDPRNADLVSGQLTEALQRLARDVEEGRISHKKYRQELAPIVESIQINPSYAEWNERLYRLTKGGKLSTLSRRLRTRALRQAASDADLTQEQYNQLLTFYDTAGLPRRDEAEFYEDTQDNPSKSGRPMLLAVAALVGLVLYGSRNTL